MSLNSFGETLRTEAGILADVVRGRAFVETLRPSKRNAVKAVITRANGSVEELGVSYNSRVDAGALWQAGIMGNATAAASMQYIALGSAALTIAKGDTVLASEITTNGCGRALGTYGTYTAPASLNGAASYVISKTFTATGAQTVNAAALFNAVSAGTMFVEANLSSAATLANGDTLAITWTINI
jgi:hypothetical protein